MHQTKTYFSKIAWFCWSLKEINFWFLIYIGLRTKTSFSLFKICFGLRITFCEETKNTHLFYFVFSILIHFDWKNFKFSCFFHFWSILVLFFFFPVCFWIDLVGSTRPFQLSRVFPTASTRSCWPGRNNKII